MSQPPTPCPGCRRSSARYLDHLEAAAHGAGFGVICFTCGLTDSPRPAPPLVARFFATMREILSR